MRPFCFLFLSRFFLALMSNSVFAASLFGIWDSTWQIGELVGPLFWDQPQDDEEVDTDSHEGDDPWSAATEHLGCLPEAVFPTPCGRKCRRIVRNYDMFFKKRMSYGWFEGNHPWYFLFGSTCMVCLWLHVWEGKLYSAVDIGGGSSFAQALTPSRGRTQALGDGARPTFVQALRKRAITVACCLFAGRGAQRIAPRNCLAAGI